MKKTRIIIAILILLGATSLAEAQIVVSSTTASTIHIKSGREKGFVIRPEVEIGSTFNNELMFGLKNSLGYQINPYFFVGGGLGLFHADLYDGWPMPIYANFRAYCCDRKWSPFFDLKVGYDIPLVTPTNNYKIQGYNITGTIGIQCRNFDLGVTIGGFNCFRKQDLQYYIDNPVGFATLNVAYNFQLNKK